ncbi:MAG: tRNA pseudouridine(38-40) synthase TruA [Sphingobacteriales bacterium JAD_PAG50586_3]|nr:MAG: tRNA pseudouridine(38-40) synthase TruA [Sphingobacteriales bacterium JAD_PAG50586_3]
MPRYFIRLAYKGTNYNGWQVQPNAPTVQAELEKALSLILRQQIEVVGCGRTDTGVHASDYYAHFDVEVGIADTAELVYKLNKFISPDIAIRDIAEVNASAHARFDATQRVYEYKIVKHKNPFTQGLAYYYFGSLDIDAMNKAAALLLDVKDFKAFSKAHTDVKTTLCNVILAKWEDKDDVLVFTIAANRFLRNMVRAVVGTLLEVGRGKMTIDEFMQVVNSLERSSAGDSAPAEGLYLSKIIYPQTVFKV